jgi:mRNA interferase RelE/StbE
MSYEIKLTTRAEKQFLKLSVSIQKRIAEKIDALAINPYPQGSKKLSGLDAYRIRIGDYRVIYQIHDDILLITIIKIGHRREVYR